MASLFLSRLSTEKRNELITRLYEMQRGICFICERPIDLAIHAGSLDIDHVEPLSAGGKDDEANLAITHDSCNRSKQASDLRVARDRLARYRQERGLPEDAMNFSEIDLYTHFKGEAREVKRYIIDNQRDQITSHPDNRLVEFMDYAGKGAEKPLSYSTIEKSFYSFFIYPNLLETPLDYGEDTGENPRELEISQIVALMNVLAEEVYIDKFDPVLGASRIESKVQKDEPVPDEHLRAFRMAKEEVLYSWLKYVQQIVLHHFVAVGMPIDDKRLFQYRFSDVLWRQLCAYVRNLAGLPLWVNHGLSATVFGGKQTSDFWRTIWETGNSPQGTAVLATRIDLTALTTIGEAVPVA